MLQTLITMLDSFAVHAHHEIESAVLTICDRNVNPFILMISMMMYETVTMHQTDINIFDL